MRYGISKQTTPKMPYLGKGTECIKILLSQASKTCKNRHYPPITLPYCEIPQGYWSLLFLCLFDMNVLLWERYLDAVLVERVVDALEDIADDIGLLGGIGPDEHLEVDAGVCQLANHRLYLLRVVHPFVFHSIDGSIDKVHRLLQV